MTFKYVTLDVSFAQNTDAFGINNNGQIVGDSSVGGSVDGYAYNSASGTFIAVDDPSGMGTMPYGISNPQQNGDDFIVGSYSTNSGGDAFSRFGGVYLPVSGFFPAGTTYSAFTGVSENGAYAVGLYQPAANTYASILVSAASPTSPVTLPSLGVDGTSAYGVNNKGEIVGYYDDNGVDRGFLYRSSTGTFTYINDPHGTKGTEAMGINDEGEIVGMFTNANDVRHGFLYKISTKQFTTLTDPHAGNAPGLGTIAFGINDHGEIVGTYIDSTSTFNGFHTIV